MNVIKKFDLSCSSIEMMTDRHAVLILLVLVHIQVHIVRYGPVHKLILKKKKNIIFFNLIIIFATNFNAQKLRNFNNYKNPPSWMGTNW